MLNEDAFRALIMEDQYPILSHNQIEYFCTTFTDINQAAYLSCMLKAKSDKVTVGPITIENDSSYWKELAGTFLMLAKTNGSQSNSVSGRCIGRADEF